MLTLFEVRQFYDSVRELAQLGLDLHSELNPAAGPLAALAIEYMTGKLSGYTVEDVLVTIGGISNHATKTLPVSGTSESALTDVLAPGPGYLQHDNSRRPGVLGYADSSGAPRKPPELLDDQILDGHINRA